MQYEGVLTKMQTEYGNPIQYYLIFENDFVHVNQLLGREIEMNLVGYQCLHCVKKKKIFRQGFCYDCFYKSPHSGDWIIRPELSTAHLGIADRDLEVESQAQLQPHVVYLAASCEIKVGVTRKSQVPTRWIDQGACSAIAVVEVPNRYLAGISEVALKNHYTDKTNWRRMLLNELVECDLCSERLKVLDLLPDEVKKFFNPEKNDIYELTYPVLQYPKKVTTLNLDKISGFRGKLSGIKGQYLIFEDGRAINVRGAEGFVVRINV
ncbi:MAG TPA: DUF2797 domain-containing protein [Flavobacterium sp.]|jgi:hypothetical protein